MSLDEFEIVKRYFSSLSTGAGVVLGPGDDAAIIKVPAGHALQVSNDTLVENVHFFSEMSPADIGYRAVMSAASDLAAMGATPLGMLMSLTIPQVDCTWLESFAEGITTACKYCSLPLIGGDTTRGPRAISITVLGSVLVGKSLLRSGANIGDRVCVSGTLGDAAAGLAFLSGDFRPENVDSALRAKLEARFLRPTAQIALGQSLVGTASAAIDISDGLLADAQHLALASDVSLQIFSHRVPRSDALLGVTAESLGLQWALTGGEDYQLLFTLPQGIEIPGGCSEIGRAMAGVGVKCDIMSDVLGYRHFGK